MRAVHAPAPPIRTRGISQPPDEESPTTLDGSTIVLGESAGTPVVWLVEGDLVAVDEVE